MSDRFSKINNSCLVILAIFAVTTGLVYLRPIMVPFVFSIFIYAALLPLLFWFDERLKFNRWLAVACTSVVFLGISFLFALLISISFENFFASADVYRIKTTEFIDSTLEWAYLKGIPINYEELSLSIRKIPILGFAKSFTGGVFSLLGNFLLIVVFVIFFLAGDGKGNKNPMLKQVQIQISQYINLKFVVSFLTGVLAGILLFSFQVELAIMFAVLTIILNFIPNIGSIVATLLPLPVILLQYGLGWQFVTILSILGIIQFTIGNILEPKWMGVSLNLHPVAVLFFLVFWGLIWGIPGMFLAVPITAFMKIIFERIEATKAFADLLSGKIPDE